MLGHPSRRILLPPNPAEPVGCFGEALPLQTPGLAPDGMRILAFDLDLEQPAGAISREEKRLIRRFIRDERTQAVRIAIAERTADDLDETHRGFLLAAYSFVTDHNREQVVDGMLAAYGGFRRAYSSATMWQGTAGMLDGGPSYVAVGLFLPNEEATPDRLIDAGTDLVQALEKAHARLLPPPVDLGLHDDDEDGPGSGPADNVQGEEPEPRHSALTHRIAVAMGMAIDRLTSEFLEDLGKLGGHRKNRAQSTLLYRMLPPCFRSHYDEAFLRRFFVAFITATEKMSMEHPTSFACVAEEVAFSMVMARTEFLLVSDRAGRGSLDDHTPGSLDMQPTAISELRRYIADVLPRPTVYALYQLTEAQIDNEGMQFLLGTGWLTTDRWFEPFAETSVHPYLSEVYNVRGFVFGP